VVTGAELACLPDGWQRCRAYLAGCDLHNHGYWWEAHYAWERIWRPADRKGALACFLKALIQVAGAHLLVRQGQLAQGTKLIEKALPNLKRATAPDHARPFMGLDVRSWQATLKAYYATLDPHDPVHQPATYPYLNLQSAGSEKKVVVE
jgi:hypothetical protein